MRMTEQEAREGGDEKRPLGEDSVVFVCECTHDSNIYARRSCPTYKHKANIRRLEGGKP